MAPAEGIGTGCILEGVIIEIPKSRQKVFHVKFDHCVWKQGSVEDIEAGVLQYASTIGPSTAVSSALPQNSSDGNTGGDVCVTETHTIEESPVPSPEPSVESPPEVNDDLFLESDDEGEGGCEGEIFLSEATEITQDSEDGTEDTINVEDVLQQQEDVLEATSAQLPVNTDLSQWMSNDALKKLCWTSNTGGIPPNTAADDLYNGQASISNYAMDSLNSPLQAFLLQLPLSFWDNVLLESNRYLHQWKEGRGTNEFSPAYRDIERWELFKFLGLCFARVLQPFTQGLRYHWGKDAITAGIRFGDHISRNRFEFIARFLHFSDNQDQRAKTDKGWKVRPFLTTLNMTMPACFDLGCKVSFDEATLPSHSRYMPIKMYNPMKPHKWGAKCYMVCCAETAYCHKFELYLGKQRSTNVDNMAVDTKCGPAAMLRNVEYLREKDGEGRRIIFCDRAYTSVLLFIQMLVMGIYAVGTIMTNRIGFSKMAIMKKHKDIERGKTTVCTTASIPSMACVGWWDNRGVHFLSTGVDCCVNQSVSRRIRGSAAKQPIKCSYIVKEYHDNMGGVDVHDLLRLCSYSLQMLFTFRKWYKGIAFAFIDIAQVNAWLLYKLKHSQRKTMDGEKNMMFKERGEFVSCLATGFLDLGSSERDENIRRTSMSTSRFVTLPAVQISHNESDVIQHVTQSVYNSRGVLKQLKCVVCGKKSSKACNTCVAGQTLGLCKFSRDSSEDTCWKKWHHESVQRQDLTKLLKSIEGRRALLSTPVKKIACSMRRRSTKVRLSTDGKRLFTAK